MSERPPSPLVSRVLEIVIRDLGNVQVASRLDATPLLLEMWQKGQAQMPQDTFLRLVDVLVELAPGWEEWDKK